MDFTPSAVAPAAERWPRRPLVVSLATLAALLALTSFLSHWHNRELLARARRYYERGAELAARGHAAEAIEQYRNALAISRDNPRYQLAVALALMDMRNTQEASVYLHEALEKDPSDAVPNLMLARIAAGDGRTDDAIAYYNRAIYGRWADDPARHSIDTRLEFIRFLAGTHGQKKVVAELLQLVEQNPPPDVKRMVAGMLLEYGSPNQAADTYRDLERSGVRDAGVYAGLGQALLEVGNYREARKMLARAYREDPSGASVAKELKTVEQVLALDPAARGLKSEARYARSRTLLQKTVAALQECMEPGSAAYANARGVEDEAAALLKARRRDRDELADEAISLARELWSLRQQACGPPPASLDALSRVLKRVSH